MGYGEWTQIEIHNTSSLPIVFKNAQHSWGKFYRSPDKGQEKQPDDLNGTTVNANGVYTIGACGRENTWSGCDGSFDLFDNSSGTTVANIKYYSPHGTSYNAFSITCPSSAWSASQTGAYVGNDGPLGAITLTVVKVK